jgi:hypothetical protein
MQDSRYSPASMPAEFPTDPSGLPEATRPRLLELADGDVLDLEVGPVAKRLGDTTVRNRTCTATCSTRPGETPPSEPQRSSTPPARARSLAFPSTVSAEEWVHQ